MSILASSPTTNSKRCSKSRQQRRGELLGKLAEELGYVTEEQLAQALAEQWGMQVIHLGDIVILAASAQSYVTEPMAQMYRIIPVSFRRRTR